MTTKRIPIMARILALLACAGLLASCATTQAPTVKAMAQGISSTGAIILLDKKPDVAPKLAKAVKGLDGLVLLDSGSTTNVQVILAQALSGTPGAEVLAANLAIFIDWINTQILHLDQRDAWVRFVKPSAEGISAGFQQALALHH